MPDPVDPQSDALVDDILEGEDFSQVPLEHWSVEYQDDVEEDVRYEGDEELMYISSYLKRKFPPRVARSLAEDILEEFPGDAGMRRYAMLRLCGGGPCPDCGRPLSRIEGGYGCGNHSFTERPWQ